MNNEFYIRPLHVGISVSDMDVSIQWYEKNMGFEVRKDNYEPALKARVCFLQRDGYEIELFQHDEKKEMPTERTVPNMDIETIGTKHAAFLIKDMAGMKELFVKNGVDIAHEVQMEEESVMFVRDPDGVLIEFIEK